MIHQLKAVVGFKENDDVTDTEEQVSDVAEDKDENKDAKKANNDKEILKIRIEELSLSSRVETALGDAGKRLWVAWTDHLDAGPGAGQFPLAPVS